MKTLVIAPHPDDEVLGMGGTIARLSDEENDITVVIATKGWAPLFPEPLVDQVRTEAREANALLGVKSLRFMDLPVTRLNEKPLHELNAYFDQVIKEEMPSIVFLPFPGDRHEDHRIIYNACMVALRPLADRRHIEKILCYETVSETHWSAAYMETNFLPQMWVDISPYLPRKVEAMRTYASQVQQEPDARSIEALIALAKWRGSTMGMLAAESFVVVRDCWQLA
jgi:LmbE family N-acetylglucosaminyl deacetylase